MELWMIFGRLKHCLALALVALLIGQTYFAAFAQSLGDTTASNDAPASKSNDKAAAIARFNSRIASESSDRVWQMTGPFGGDVTALTVDPRQADHIVIGTSDGQLFRSIDGGTIWKRLRPGINAPGFIVTVILFDQEQPKTIYTGVKPITDITEQTAAGGGLFVSTDGGESWRELTGLRGRAVRGLVQSAADPNVLAVAARDGIYRTTDRGQKWERITPTDDPELRNFHSVALDPRSTDTVYVGTSHLPWKTVDAGRTWKRAGSKETGMIDDSDIMSIHIDQANPDTVLMSACSGIYRSTDASARWTKIQGIPSTSRRTHTIFQHPTRTDVIFAGTTEGLWLSTGGGKPETWRRVTSLRLTINAVAVHPDRPDRVFLGTEDNGVLISNDGGESYEASNAGFVNRHVRTVLADRTERGRVYAGVIFDGVNSGLFASEDGGITWQQSMQGMGVRDVYSLYQPAARPETIYAGTNHGLFRSDDHGRNWAQVKKEEEVQAEGDAKGNRAAPATVAPKIAPATPRAAPSTKQPTSAPRPRRLAETKLIKPVVQTRVKPRAAKAKGPGRQSAANKKPTQKQSPASKRSPGRKTAQKKPKPAAPPPPPERVDLSRQVFALIPFTPLPVADAAPGDAAALPAAEWLIAETWDGLFYTEDEKKGWKQLKLRLKPEGEAEPRIDVMVTSPHAPGLFLVGTEEGLFVSRDNGASFQPMPLEGEARRVRSIAFDPRTAQTIYVGTATGFFRSLNGGRTWEHRGGGMPQMVNVDALVVSQANPDELYLRDELRYTFYHSKDRGQHWERLEAAQLPSLKLWAIVSDPFEHGRFYVGSNSGGVYVLGRQ